LLVNGIFGLDHLVFVLLPLLLELILDLFDLLLMGLVDDHNFLVFVIEKLFKIGNFSQHFGLELIELSLAFLLTHLKRNLPKVFPFFEAQFFQLFLTLVELFFMPFDLIIMDLISFIFIFLMFPFYIGQLNGVGALESFLVALDLRHLCIVLEKLLLLFGKASLTYCT
jgi:hypothetical protein